MRLKLLIHVRRELVSDLVYTWATVALIGDTSLQSESPICCTPPPGLFDCQLHPETSKDLIVVFNVTSTDNHIQHNIDRAIFNIDIHIYLLIKSFNQM
jgi:hypothetical protein